LQTSLEVCALARQLLLTLAFAWPPRLGHSRQRLLDARQALCQQGMLELPTQDAPFASHVHGHSSFKGGAL
jgi:hypothetical protein